MKNVYKMAAVGCIVQDMDEPVVLPIGTGVSARYRGAFCEAKITKVAKCVKCKVQIHVLTLSN